MDYLRFANYEEELIQISAIKEEDEGEMDSRRERSITLKSDGRTSPKLRSTEEAISDIQAELSDLSHRFSNPSVKTKRLGYKIQAADSEFPLLVRGLESEKNKEFELMKKKSIKESFYHQSSLDEEKEDAGSLKSDSIPLFGEDLYEEEDLSNLKMSSVVIEEIVSVASSMQYSPCENKKNFNTGALKSVISENWHYKNRLYLAINENELDSKAMNLTKGVYFVKEKDDALLEIALKNVKEVEHGFGEATLRNLELKKNLERLKNERKKLKHEYDSNSSSIKSVLSSLQEEKMNSQMSLKNLGLHFSDEISKNTEYSRRLLEAYENYQKVSEQLREIQECWKMNINDLSINLYEVSKKREALEKKFIRNQTFVEDLKVMSSLAIFQREQIDFCLEMISKTMEFFAESKEHKHFNKNFAEALKRIKAASQESLEAVVQFEIQATKDPRELIPYTRVSDTGPGTKQERISLSTKANNSKIIIKDSY